MPTPGFKHELFEGGRAGSSQESRYSADPVEKEVDSSKEILDRVLSHEAHTRTIEADVEDIVKWWGRTKALLDMYKTLDGLKNAIAIGLAKIGFDQLLSDDQYKTLSEYLIAHKHEVDARIEFYLAGLKKKTPKTENGEKEEEEKESPLTLDVRRVKDEVRTFYGKVAPVVKPR